jgi:hypothetical protein
MFAPAVRNRLRAPLLLGAAVALALVAWRASRLAADESFALEIQITYGDSSRSVTWKTSISDEDARDFQSRPESVQGRYLTEAKKKMAQRQGYTEAIYGPDYWKIPQVAKWFFTVRDPRSNRTVVSNRP